VLLSKVRTGASPVSVSSVKLATLLRRIASGELYHVIYEMGKTCSDSLCY
jgi:hypothetical protein